MPFLSSPFEKTHVEKACFFLLYSEWILWGNGSINCDTATLFVKFFHKEITASGTHRPTYYSQTTHWEEMHWPQVCYITISVTPPRIWIVHLDEVSEVIKSSLHNKPWTWVSSVFECLNSAEGARKAKFSTVLLGFWCCFGLFKIHITDSLFYCSVPRKREKTFICTHLSSLSFRRIIQTSLLDDMASWILQAGCEQRPQSLGPDRRVLLLYSWRNTDQVQNYQGFLPLTQGILWVDGWQSNPLYSTKAHPSQKGPVRSFKQLNGLEADIIT